MMNIGLISKAIESIKAETELLNFNSNQVQNVLQHMLSRAFPPAEDNHSIDLSADEKKYLLSLATPPNDGTVAYCLITHRHPSQTEKYRQMLERFVELDLMYRGPNGWCLTIKGREFAAAE